MVQHTEKTIKKVIEQLQKHPDAIVRWKVTKDLIGCDPVTPEYQTAKQAITTSMIVQKLLSDRNSDGQLPHHPYNKWFGAHWILYILADLDYPEGDEKLKPMLEQCYSWLLSPNHAKHIKEVNGRVRRCASQEGNCVYYSLALGIADERTEELAARLIRWQWEDGGWNCDKKPEATKSSFHESLIPLRALSLYTHQTGNPKARQAAERAADIFLKRRLFKRLSDGKIINASFVQLHYPGYWHYDILFGLKVMCETGFINDPRCSEALNLLESKQLADGGFPAEARYYRVDEKKLSGHSHVDWGGTSKKHMNPFVTIDAFSVLKQAGRLIY